MPASGQRGSLLAQRQLGGVQRHGAEGGSPSPVPPPFSVTFLVVPLPSPPDHSKVPSRLDDTPEKTKLRDGQWVTGRQGVGRRGFRGG